MQRAFNLVLTAWAGSLWTICGIVAPSLFVLSNDRHQAGEFAAYFFRLETWIGLGLGSIALFLLARGASAWRKPLDIGFLLIAQFTPVISELGLRTAMESARVSGDMQRFGVLHGISAMLFVVAALSAVIIVWRLTTPRN